LHVARRHHLHVTVSHTLPTSNGCHLHAAVSHTSPLLVRVASSRVVPTSDSCHLCVAVDCASPSLTRHHQPHGAPKQCLSPAHRRCLRVTVRVAVGRTVPLSDARQPCVTIACMSPSAAWCAQAMPITRMSPLPARHRSYRRRPHGAHEQRLSPACRRCLRITVHIAVSRMVPTSNACHLHIAIAVDVPLPYPT